MIRISDIWDRRTATHVAAALFLGLILRLFFVLHFPAADSDSEMYEDLGRNVVDNHMYAYDFGRGAVPTDIRVPGYPLFVGFVYLFSPSEQAILVAQAIVDLGTCLLVAALAGLLAPDGSRRRVATAALWLSATCPFVANYAAVAMTEVLATFFTAAALVILVWANQRELLRPGPLWFLGGAMVGLGALVRPETPITLAAPAVVLSWHWMKSGFKPTDWPRLIRTGLLLAAGMFIALLPWAARNWITLHEVEFLTDRYIHSPGSYVPVGFYQWTHTWLSSYWDVDHVLNRLEEAPLYIADFPPSAFDSGIERARVESLLESQHQGSFEISPDADQQFSELARERTALNPLRTYVTVPLRRSLTFWFTPRTELLPYSGEWWPLLRSSEDYDGPFALAFLFAMLNFLYAGLALAGAFRMWRQYGVALLAAFLVARTLFIAVEHYTVEPRFVLPCIPAVLALGALAWAGESGGELRLDGARSNISDS